MWIYSGITREEFELRKDFVENIFCEAGATVTDLDRLHTTTSYYSFNDYSGGIR